MPRKDPQKWRVYKWHRAFDPSGGYLSEMAEEDKITLPQCGVLFTAASDLYGVPSPFVEDTDRKRGYYYDKTIYLGERHRFPLYALHEYAHYVLDEYRVIEADHGPIFARVSLDLLNAFGIAERFLAYNIGKGYGVDFAPPAKAPKPRAHGYCRGLEILEEYV